LARQSGWQAGNTGIQWCVSLLRAYVKLRKATFSFVVSVCPSAWNSSAATGHIFIKSGSWVFFENMWRKCKFDWYLTRIRGTLREDMCVDGLSLSSCRTEKYGRQKL
jgi:hypothetical protein